MSSSVLAVVPARGGSKRLPRKNTKRLDGKPLVAHAIEDANGAETVDRTVVSTEDNEIREIAVSYGGDVPFDRPPELATDTATADEVVRHVLEELARLGEEYEVVCMVFATTPFRATEDIDESVRELQSTDAQSVVGVTDFDHPPFYALDRDEEGFLTPHFGEEYLWSTTRSQEFPDVRLPNGAVFVAEVPALFEHENFYTDRTRGYYMPPRRSIDIDTPFDLEVARALVRYGEAV